MHPKSQQDVALREGSLLSSTNPLGVSQVGRAGGLASVPITIFRLGFHEEGMSESATQDSVHLMSSCPTWHHFPCSSVRRLLYTTCRMRSAPAIMRSFMLRDRRKRKDLRSYWNCREYSFVVFWHALTNLSYHQSSCHCSSRLQRGDQVAPVAASCCYRLIHQVMSHHSAAPQALNAFKRRDLRRLL